MDRDDWPLYLDDCPRRKNPNHCTETHLSFIWFKVNLDLFGLKDLAKKDKTKPDFLYKHRYNLLGYKEKGKFSLL